MVFVAAGLHFAVDPVLQLPTLAGWCPGSPRLSCRVQILGRYWPIGLVFGLVPI